ncbi:MAG: hypothetical protein ABGW91_06760 [Christiangramia sp.]
MTTDAQEFWNERYAASEYIYGITPNLFYKSNWKNCNPAVSYYRQTGKAEMLFTPLKTGGRSLLSIFPKRE